jgi:peptidoglycan/LPS O-acetylase OafA/YrhL
MKSYRPDIDGLRAIAVLAVVVFHSFPNAWKGGFSGVDIFFVISGYLITSIMIHDFEENKFKFSDFYARRV